MTTNNKTEWNGFIVLPNDNIVVIEPNQIHMVTHVRADGLFADLRTAGYPICHDLYGIHDQFFNLTVDPTNPTEVVAYTTRNEPREHMLGEASSVFLAWYHANVTEKS